MICIIAYQGIVSGEFRMWNIEYKGKIKGDIEQISSGKPLPEGSVMFKEPDSPNKAFALGALFAFPILVLMMGFATYRMVLIYDKPYGLKLGDFIVPHVICLALIVISQYVHEYIHAFLLPKNVKKEVYVMLENQMLFVYCEECVSKKRFMISLLGPAVILGLIPYIVWYIIAPNLSFPLTLAMLLYSFAMAACAVGDYLNAYNCARQVPRNGKVFNRGFHSYWIP